jgi:hypothetical protein
VTPLSEVHEVFQRWLYLPDTAPLDVVLAAIIANRLPGDPAWIGVIAPPSNGKTEMLEATSGLAEVFSAATLTEASLLSGTPGRERAKDASGGLLREIGEYGIILCKDFTSVLAMNKDTRGQVLAGLREIYDGNWTRHVGTDGGRTLAWRGKCGLLAGVTPTIDRHHATMSALGERFAWFRIDEVDDDEQSIISLRNEGHEAEMRRELREAITALFETLAVPDELPATTPEDQRRLVTLAGFVVKARSAVERDGYTREIELIPRSEGSARLAKMLSHMLISMRLVGVPAGEDWRVVNKLGLDSIPATRRSVLEYLVDRQGLAPTNEIAEACGYPTRTAERALEDLTAHGVAHCKRGGQGVANQWRLTEWAGARWHLIHTSPENPGDLFTTRTHTDGLSGEVRVAPNQAVSSEAPLVADAPAGERLKDEDEAELNAMYERAFGHDAGAES